jgi:hypothetical protein
MSKISVGDRIRWKPRGEKQGLVGHEGTVVALSMPEDRHFRWAWVEYDDGTEKDAYLSELEKIES